MATSNVGVGNAGKLENTFELSMQVIDSMRLQDGDFTLPVMSKVSQNKPERTHVVESSVIIEAIVKNSLAKTVYTCTARPCDHHFYTSPVCK